MTVSLRELYTPNKGELTDFLKEVTDTKIFYTAYHKHLRGLRKLDRLRSWLAVLPLPSPATTAASPFTASAASAW